MTIADALQNVVRLGIDTAPLIYFVERNPIFLPVCRAAFLEIDRGTIQAVTGSITLTEVLVKPLRNGDMKLAADYRALIYQTRNLSIAPIMPATAESAADLRARYNLRTPDALQIASALSAGCDAFLTGDKDLRRVVELKILVLSDLTL